MSAGSSSSSRLWLLALGYIPILGLLVPLLEKRDPEFTAKASEIPRIY